MAVSFHGGFDALMAQALGDEQGREAHFHQQAGVAVPLRYNYDKPEKPCGTGALRVWAYLFHSFSTYEKAAWKS
jgi:hypothetical protein